MDKEKLQILENLLDVVSTKETADELLKTFEIALEIFKDLKINNEEERKEMRSIFRQYEGKMDDMHKGMSSDGKKLLANLATKIEEKLGKAFDDQKNSLDFIRDKVRKIKEGKDGHTPTKDELLDLIKPLIKLPEAEKLLGTTILTKVQELKEGKRWEIEDVNDLRKELDELRKLWKTFGGGTTFVGSSPYQPTTILVATGTLDDSNVNFEFSQKPTIINVNGANYIEDHGWSWSGNTATLDFPPGAMGFVYGII